MHPSATDQKLRALPVQLIEVEDGVFVRRGTTTFKISGEHAHRTVRLVLDATAGNALTRAEIGAQFPAPVRPAIDVLTAKLCERRILVPADAASGADGETESALDVFYWNFGLKSQQVADRLSKRRIAILGVNHVSRRLAAALGVSGARNVDVVDYHLLRNVDLFDASGELVALEWPGSQPAPVSYEQWASTLADDSIACLVATSDIGATEPMREWNRVCVKQNWHFLPVVLQDLVGYIGPLVVPGETACYECLRARQNSHLENPEVHRATERHAVEGQHVAGVHPSIASVLGDMAALELAKFYGSFVPLWRVGTLIEVNLLVPSVVGRKVLRLPRCSVCGTLNTRSAVTPVVNIFTPATVE
jgi:bacteriocin biosynthesis cyclodehydratase domain-containing protein